MPGPGGVKVMVHNLLSPARTTGSPSLDSSRTLDRGRTWWTKNLRVIQVMVSGLC